MEILFAGPNLPLTSRHSRPFEEGLFSGRDTNLGFFAPFNCENINAYYVLPRRASFASAPHSPPQRKITSTRSSAFAICVRILLRLENLFSISGNAAGASLPGERRLASVAVDDPEKKGQPPADVLIGNRVEITMECLPTNYEERKIYTKERTK